jgi:polyribonucleotide nucleotidyltransferase
MDIKIQGITKEIMQVALAQAKEAACTSWARCRKPWAGQDRGVRLRARKLYTMKINPEKIRDVIGKGGAVIRALTEETGCQIDIEEDGTITIASTDAAKAERPRSASSRSRPKWKSARSTKARSPRSWTFGALINLLPGKDGLLHISQIAHERVEKVTDYLKEGQIVKVKVLETDEKGRVKLSMKAVSVPCWLVVAMPSGAWRRWSSAFRSLRA